jgi:ubiquinone/menaquinone biosynthesis C-methylase UbiE
LRRTLECITGQTYRNLEIIVSDNCSPGDEIGFHEGEWDQSRIGIISDITAIPRPDASFDAVMCIEVLEHVPNPTDSVRELVRLLKPGGTLIITAPFCALTHFSPYFYHTGFSQNFYKHWLSYYGCEIEDMVFNGNFFEYMGQELRHIPSMGNQYSGITPTIIEKDAIEVVLGLLAHLSEKGYRLS